MDQKVVFSDATLTDRDDFRMSATHPNPFIALLTKNHRLAVLEIQNLIGTNCALRKVIKGVIVEDVAVLIDLDEGNAFVLGSRFNYLTEMFDIYVN